MNNKVIILDYGMFLHRAIFSWRNRKNIPMEYTLLSMIVSSLSKIGLEPYDIVIVAVDGRHSWRKDIEEEYKANRKAYRDSFDDINWQDMYKKSDILLDKINKGTDWHIIKENGLEADDIMAVGCRYFNNKEIILCTFDSDLEQCFIYDNVKIFSPLKKAKGSKGAYKVKPKNFNVYKLISKKIEKEVSDNLVNPILNEEDYEKRKQCVSLIELPEIIENKIINIFDNLKEKEKIDINYIPFITIRKRINKLYNDKNKKIDYDYCVKLETKRRKRKRRKK